MNTALMISSTLSGVLVTALLWRQSLAIRLKTLGLALTFGAVMIVVSTTLRIS